MQWIKENIPTVFCRVRCILDNNPKKWGIELMGIQVLEPQKDILSQMALLAITCGEGNVIIEQLESLGLDNHTRIIISDISFI